MEHAIYATTDDSTFTHVLWDDEFLHPILCLYDSFKRLLQARYGNFIH